jgi:TRAP-type uncharacterized transport system fused permease subunit
MEIDHEKTQKLAEKYDSEIRFRPLDKTATWIVSGLLVTLSLFHYYTAGFGLLREATHRGVHLAFVLSLIFLVFGFSKSHYQREPKSTWFSPGGIPLYDWIIAVALALSVLYIPYIFEDLAFRVGNPMPCRSLRWSSWPMRCSGRTFPACSNMRATRGRRSSTTCI